MRTLVIDDEPLIREQVALCLRQESYSVDTASDGTEGFYLARMNDYDVIVMDNMLPEKTGEILCREIRQVGKHTPILVLSVLNEAWRKADVLNAGADDYLTKPFAVDELTARVRALSRRTGTFVGNVLTVDDLELDSRRQTVRRAGLPISLTRKEFNLLEYLMRNEGIVATRARIADQVWDMHTDAASNTIDSHIMNLRRKVDRGTSPKLIHTVSGRGYLLGIRE